MEGYRLIGKDGQGRSCAPQGWVWDQHCLTFLLVTCTGAKTEANFSSSTPPLKTSPEVKTPPTSHIVLSPVTWMTEKGQLKVSRGSKPRVPAAIPCQQQAHQQNLHTSGDAPALQKVH